jgi:5'-deoxynucleotidase YfbR-like HD superfamily hydrolase
MRSKFMETNSAEDHVKISVAGNFTITPGGRFKVDGPFSGEEFREIWLEPLFQNDPPAKIIIDLDNVEGYSTAFLEETFGGLVRKFGKEKVKFSMFEFISDEEPLLLEEIKGYIEKALA